jgi:hypothetical protein
MIPLAQWAMKNYTPEVRNVGLSLILILIGESELQKRCPLLVAADVRRRPSVNTKPEVMVIQESVSRRRLRASAMGAALLA